MQAGSRHFSQRRPFSKMEETPCFLIGVANVTHQPHSTTGALMFGQYYCHWEEDIL